MARSKRGIAAAAVSAALLIPDTHAPYHDERAWGICMNVGADLAPKYLRIVGDFPDFYSISRHKKDPARPFKLKDEIRITNRLLDDVDSLGATDKVYNKGNHDQRLQDYYANTASELHGCDGTTLEEVLRLTARGYSVVDYHEDSKLGSLTVTHDAEFCGKYAVEHTLQVYHRDIAFGHVHTLAAKYANDADGRAFYGASLGWLGDLKWINYRPKVSAKKAYTHGFGIGWVDESTGRVHLQLVPILDGVAIFNGKRYT